MPFFKKSLNGPGFVILNALRVVNIIVLLACVAASFVMLVKTFVVSKFFFFDAVSHLVTGILSIMLIITELPLFRRYVANNWPLLSPSHGFVTLGVIMIFLGVTILGNLNKEATSEESLGTAYWRIVIASGILACIFGLVNIFANYAFRNKANGVTARQVRMHGRLADQKVYLPPGAPTTFSSPPLSHKGSMASQPEKQRSFFFPGVRSATMPNPSHYRPASSHYSEHGASTYRNISAPINRGGPAPAMSQRPSSPTLTNYSLPARSVFGSGRSRKHPDEEEGYAPVVNGIQRPDLAHHPALQGGRF